MLIVVSVFCSLNCLLFCLFQFIHENVNSTTTQPYEKGKLSACLMTVCQQIEADMQASLLSSIRRWIPHCSIYDPVPLSTHALGFCSVGYRSSRQKGTDNGSGGNRDFEQMEPYLRRKDDCLS